MKRIGVLALGLACVFGAAAPASAGVTFVGFQTALNPGETLVTGFEGGPSLASTLFAAAGYSLTGTAKLVTGSQTGVTAAPATGVGTRDTTQYLSVQHNQTATLDTPLLKSISFYVGSLDRYNIFSFHLADGTTQTILGFLPGTIANGNQTAATSNGRVTFSFASAIDSVLLDSGGNSLEISDIGAVAAIPEPQSWALMITGLAMVGGLARSRRKALPAT